MRCRYQLTAVGVFTVICTWMIIKRLPHLRVLHWTIAGRVHPSPLKAQGQVASARETRPRSLAGRMMLPVLVLASSREI
jgi:uncharacterized membrane protein